MKKERFELIPSVYALFIKNDNVVNLDGKINELKMSWG